MNDALRAPAKPGGDLRALLEAWRADPTLERSRTLCEILHRAGRPPPPRIVAAIAARVHRQRPTPAVLVALGKLQAMAGDLRGAHDSLALADAAAPAAIEPLVALAEVLLALGDAERAVIAVETAQRRATAAGKAAVAATLEASLGRARGLCALQRSEGEGAVAAALAVFAPSTQPSGVRRRARAAASKLDVDGGGAATRAVRPSTELLDRLREADGVEVARRGPIVERRKRPKARSPR